MNVILCLLLTLQISIVGLLIYIIRTHKSQDITVNDQYDQEKQENVEFILPL